MTNLAELLIADSDGDTLHVTFEDERVEVLAEDHSDGEGAEVHLDHAAVLDLHRSLGAWLDDYELANSRPRHADHDCVLMDCAAKLLANRPNAEADGYSWGASTEADYGLRSALRAPTGATESSVATEAHDAVYGDRHADYGHPREDFTRTAVLWTGLLQHKLAEGEFITAEDMARCMIAVKLSRDVHSPKRDNRVDMAGYAITLDRLESGK